MAITHIEDLDVKSFIKVVRNIANFQATEKLDGAQLWFGLDENGELYTSRAGKREGSERFYSESDYPYFAAYNGFRGAHAALEAEKTQIKSVLEPGDTIEIEILYGRQPNAISYGLDDKNFIAFLRGVEGTPDSKVNDLIKLLENKEASVKTIIVETSDGENLDRKEVTQIFRFVGVQKIDASLLKSVNIEKELKNLEDYLDSDSGIKGLSNFELMSTSLGSIPKEERVDAKAAKENIISNIKLDYKLQIKKELLNQFVNKIKPALAAKDLSNDEDVGIEGVVLKDPVTGEQLKIVDKDTFTTINQFNFAVRNQIAGMVRTTDDASPLESRGGITGQMKIRIADLLGNKDLAIGRSAKKIFLNAKGESIEETIKNISKILNGSQDFNGTKRKIEAIISATDEELKEMLSKFKKHKDDAETSYKLKLKSGKSLGLSPEIIKRTLMTFAETKRNLVELSQRVNESKSFEDLIGVLYGRGIKSIHGAGDEAEDITEGLQESMEPVLLEKRNYTDIARYQTVPDALSLFHIYVVTTMMTILIYKADDAKGMRFVKDKMNYRMSKWTAEMSALNFWGYPVWHAGSPVVSKLLSKKIATEVFKISRKVPHHWVNFLHLDLSFGGDVPIDWADHLKTLKFLIQHTPGLNIDRINDIVDAGFKYEDLSYDEKVKYLPKLYFLAQQYVPTSPLISRVKAIQNKLLTGSDSTDVVITIGQNILDEEGEVAAPAASPAATVGNSSMAASPATTAGDIATVPSGIGRLNQIIKRKRNPDMKTLKFARPIPKRKNYE